LEILTYGGDFFYVIDIYIKLKNNMKKIIRLSESDLAKLVRKVIKEQSMVSSMSSNKTSASPGSDMMLKLVKLVNVGNIPCVRGKIKNEVYKLTGSKLPGLGNNPAPSPQNYIIYDASNISVPDKQWGTVRIVRNGQKGATFNLNGTPLGEQIYDIHEKVYNAQGGSSFKIGYVLCNGEVYIYDMMANQPTVTESRTTLREQASAPFLSIFPTAAALAASNIGGNNNTNIIYLTKRDAQGKEVPGSKFSYKVGGSYGFADFKITLRNVRRDATGNLLAEVLPDSGIVRTAMRKLIPAKNQTPDGWLYVKVPVAQLNDALNKLFNNKGSKAEIELEKEGIDISLERVA